MRILITFDLKKGQSYKTAYDFLNKEYDFEDFDLDENVLPTTTLFSHSTGFDNYSDFLSDVKSKKEIKEYFERFLIIEAKEFRMLY